MKNFIEKYFDDNRINGKQAIIVHSILFCVTAFVIYFLFYINNWSPFYSFDDGLPAYYPILGYIGEYIRDLLRNIFIEHTLSISLYDFRFGLGEDIFRLIWSGLLNPVVILISPFFSIKNIDICYWIICLSQLYLSGVVFILFCFYKRIDGLAAVCGSFVYIFSGFALMYFLRHYLFITPMILLPLLLIATEKIVKGENSWFFSIIVTISIFINFYFTYMMTIMIFFYGISLFFEIYKENKLKNFVKLFFRGIIFYLLGVMLAAPFFFPIILRYLQLERGSDLALSTNSLLLYSGSGLFYRVVSLFAPMSSLSSVIPISLIATICLFCKKGVLRSFKIFLILGLTGLFIPAIGYYLNGAGYVSDRWMFLLSFIFAYTFSTMFLYLPNMNEKEELRCLQGIFAYALIIAIAPLYRRSLDIINIHTLFSLIIMLFTLILLIYLKKKHFSTSSKKIFLVIIVLICCITKTYILFSPKYDNYIKGHANGKSDWSVIDMSSVFDTDYIQDFDKTAFYRCDNTLGIMQDVGCLWPIISKQNGISNYGSLTNPIFVSSQKQLENIEVRHAWKYRGFDQRSALLSLASVKYFTANRASTMLKPYGFVKKEERNRKGRKYFVFKNNYFLPIGYTYENYITQALFSKFPGVSKEELLLQSVVLEAPLPAMFRENKNIHITSKKLPFKIDFTDNLKWGENIVRTDVTNASMTVTFFSEINSEIFLRFCGLSTNGFSHYFRLKIILLDKNNVEKSILLAPNKLPWHIKMDNRVVNLGYYKEPSEIKCKIIWPNKGSFKLDDIQVYAQPMDNYPAQINKLREDVLENIYVGNDRVSGTISLKKNKILCLSIPYSKGWHAKVDGKKAELLKANSLFMALPLEAGDHKIELEYHVPGLRLGLCFFVLGVFILLVMVFYDRKKRSYERADHSDPYS